MYNAKQFTLTTGETITVSGAAIDPRNVNNISESALRSRLYSGIIDPDVLWGRNPSSAKVFTLDDGQKGTIGFFTRNPCNVNRLSMQTIRNRLQSGVTDPNELYRRARPHSRTVGYTLDDGTTITPSEAARDPRNVHHLSMGGLLNRLQRGVTDPEALFAEPNRGR